MWGSSRYLCSPERPKASTLSYSDRYCTQKEHYKENEECLSHCPFLLDSQRKQRKNHTGKLHELALLLPVAAKTSVKKFTKKEILLHILHYIQYLQRNIDVTKALLKFHSSNGPGGVGGLGQNATVDSARRRHCTPSSSPHSYKSCLRGACRKPQKKKLTRTSERQTRAQNLRRCLALDKPKKQVTPSPNRKGRIVERTTAPPRSPDSYVHPKAALFLPQGCKSRAQDDGPYPAFGAQQGAERTYFLNRSQPYPRQKLVFYDSSEEVDKDAPDADPWLPARTPESSPFGSPLALGPPQIDNLSVILGFSPSLFSSPGKLLSEQVLEDGTEYLTQALFEEVLLDPVPSPSACMLEVPQKKFTPFEALEDLPHSHSLCQFSVSPDHLSLSENSKASSSPSSEATDTDIDKESVWRQQDTQADPEGLKSSSDEDGDYTWTPTLRFSTLPLARRKNQAGRSPRKPKNKKAASPTQSKKKCVNGFIMFCRMNRKQYIRACPGTASMAATKELAKLWREMTEQERRPYCIKARRFSRQHNRIVKQESSSSNDEDCGIPKPFYQLLADKARLSSEPASQLPSHR
ncbi:meiosis initiator protein [Saccopteryx leptura]|uniref:meiosis initiator protein n=1 Tax=Saccopteryx leptura TaxID=249018 RepID=UPI00339D0E7B